MSGTQANPIGITNPPIDDLLTRADSKYALVLYGAKRARQINAYYSQLQEGLLEYIGPLVDAQVHEKPLSIALREINDGLLTNEPTSEQDESTVAVADAPELQTPAGVSDDSAPASAPADPA